jgi:colanic acid/amylovoran biosynthesis glycosyltransferase
MRVGILHSIENNINEEFLLNKIQFLLNNKVEVMLFLNKVPTNFNLCSVYSKYSKNSNLILRNLSSISSLFILIINIKKAFKLWVLNTRDGISVKNNILYLLDLAYIIRHNVDWLYFSDSTLIKGKENLAKTMNAKMVVSITASDLLIESRKVAIINSRILDKIDKFHFFSDSIESIFLNSTELKEIKISNTSVIKNSLNLKFLSNVKGTDNLNFLVQKKIFNSDKLVLCSIGSLDWKYGFDYVLESIALLKAVTANFELKIIGQGADYERLIFTVHQLGLDSHVNFINEIDICSIDYQLLRTDIYIQYNNLVNDFDVNIIRAQYLRCIPIISSAYGHADSILDGKSGFIVKKRSPNLLFQTILKLINLDDKSILKIQEETRNCVLTAFNLEIQKKNLVEFYSISE